MATSFSLIVNNYQYTMLKNGILSLVALFVVVFSACSSSAGNSQEARSSADTAEVAHEFPKKSGHEVSFQAADKSIINTRDLIGKVVFINFWATWCPPCIEEMPSIQALYNKFKDNKDIVFLLVDVDADLKGAERFMRTNKLDMPLYIPNSNLPSSFLGGAIPTTVILDKRGNIDVRLEGGRDYRAPQITQALESLLAE